MNLPARAAAPADSAEAPRRIPDLAAIGGRELRQGLTRLGRAPSFSAAVLLALGLGMGAGLPVLDLVQRGVNHPAPVTAPTGIVTPVQHTDLLSADRSEAPAVSGPPAWGGPPPRSAPAARSIEEVQRESLGVLLRTLGGAAVLILLLACTNASLLLLSRGAARRWELAMRSALGATRGRLLGQLAIEGALLLSAGWVLGTILFGAASGALHVTWPGGLAQWLVGPPGAWLIVATLALPGICTLGFTILPAFRIGARSAPALGTAAQRVTSGRQEGELRARLTTLAVALSLMLLTGAGILLRGFAAPSVTHPGYDPADSLTVRLALPALHARDAVARAEALGRLLEHLATVPGVRAESITSEGALLGLGTTDLVHALTGSPTRPGIIEPARHHSVAPAFFATMRIPLLAGREFDPRDREGADAVVVVNETFANRFFPRTTPVGRTVQLGRVSLRGTWFTVVGVVGDVRPRGIGTPSQPEPAIYFSILQVPPASVELVARTALPVEQVAPRIEAAAVQAIPGAVIGSAESLEGKLLAFRQPVAWIALLFAALALAATALSAFGLYAVISYNVARRTREIGIRTAVGARQSDILRLVVGQGLRLTLGGVALGTLGAVCLGRLLQYFFHGVSFADPVVYAAVATLLAAVAVLASWAPARRASLLDPMLALREE